MVELASVWLAWLVAALLAWGWRKDVRRMHRTDQWRLDQIRFLAQREKKPEPPPLAPRPHLRPLSLHDDQWAFTPGCGCPDCTEHSRHEVSCHARQEWQRARYISLRSELWGWLTGWWFRLLERHWPTREQQVAQAEAEAERLLHEAETSPVIGSIRVRLEDEALKKEIDALGDPGVLGLYWRAVHGEVTVMRTPEMTGPPQGGSGVPCQCGFYRGEHAHHCKWRRPPFS